MFVETMAVPALVWVSNRFPDWLAAPRITTPLFPAAPETTCSCPLMVEVPTATFAGNV